MRRSGCAVPPKEGLSSRPRLVGSRAGEASFPLFQDARGKRPDDLFDDALDVSQNLVVPEAHNDIAGGLDHLRAHAVPFNVYGVLTAINLDDEFRFNASEISNEAVDRHLTPKLCAKPRPRKRDQSLRSASVIRGVVAAPYGQAPTLTPFA
jgi:hypothetical protein